MRPPLRRPQGNLGLNLTPLVDIVFQLIVFFLVASHLAQQETSLELELPAALTGGAEPADLPPRLIINVPPADDKVWVSGQYLAPAALRQLLIAEHQLRGPALEVRIRSDRNVPYARIEPILALCAEVGIQRVTVATISKH
jgi:biopolymer transport protein ExbD